MGKSSAARQERVQRSREREAILESVRNPGREAAPADLDRLIHEHVRLGIVSALAVNRALTFNELKALLKASDGNLSVHARKLEEADYIVCAKSFEGRKVVCANRSAWRGSPGAGRRGELLNPFPGSVSTSSCRTALLACATTLTSSTTRNADPASPSAAHRSLPRATGTAAASPPRFDNSCAPVG